MSSFLNWRPYLRQFQFILLFYRPLFVLFHFRFAFLINHYIRFKKWRSFFYIESCCWSTILKWPLNFKNLLQMSLVLYNSFWIKKAWRLWIFISARIGLINFLFFRELLRDRLKVLWHIRASGFEHSIICCVGSWLFVCLKFNWVSMDWYLGFGIWVKSRQRIFIELILWIDRWFTQHESTRCC